MIEARIEITHLCRRFEKVLLKLGGDFPYSLNMLLFNTSIMVLIVNLSKGIIYLQEDL
jgi:hypothetical protein